MTRRKRERQLHPPACCFNQREMHEAKQLDPDTADLNTPARPYSSSVEVSDILFHLASIALPYIITLPANRITDAARQAAIMASTSRYSCHSGQGRLSVNVVPERLHDVEPQIPYLHWLFGESSEDETRSRLVDANLNSADAVAGYSTAEAVIMEEVAAWLELCEHDDLWASKDKHNRKACLIQTLIS